MGPSLTATVSEVRRTTRAFNIDLGIALQTSPKLHREKNEQERRKKEKKTY